MWIVVKHGYDDLHEVGFLALDGLWYPDSMWESFENAAKRCRYLNEDEPPAVGLAKAVSYEPSEEFSRKNYTDEEWEKELSGYYE